MLKSLLVFGYWLQVIIHRQMNIISQFILDSFFNRLLKTSPNSTASFLCVHCVPLSVNSCCYNRIFCCVRQAAPCPLHVIGLAAIAKQNFSNAVIFYSRYKPTPSADSLPCPLEIPLPYWDGIALFSCLLLLPYNLQNGNLPFYLIRSILKFSFVRIANASTPTQKRGFYTLTSGEFEFLTQFL